MELKINVDIDKILGDFLNGEGYDKTLEEYLKYKAKDVIHNKITLEVEKNLNIDGFTTEQVSKIKGYYDEFFNKKIKDFLDEKVSFYLEQYFNGKIKDKYHGKSFIQEKIEKYIDEYMENNFLVKLQNILNNILVVNSEKLLTEEDLAGAYQDGISDYQASL